MTLMRRDLPSGTLTFLFTGRTLTLDDALALALDEDDGGVAGR